MRRFEYLCFSFLFSVLASGCGNPAQPTQTGVAAPSIPEKPEPSKPEPVEKKAGGRYAVLGTATGGGGGSMVSDSGNQLKNEPIEIKWTVSKATYDLLKVGMTLEEARKALKLDTLSYTPRGEASEMSLICKQDKVVVKLTFAGSPAVKLTAKTASGLE